MKFKGRVEGWKNRGTDNMQEFSAAKFDGSASFGFVKENGKPSCIEFDSSFNEKEMSISVYSENVMPGKYRIDLADYKDGEHKIMVEAKKAENIWVKFILR